MALTQEQKNQFFALKEGEQKVIKNVGLVKFSNFPKDKQKEIMDRLSEKDEVMALGQKGILPGIKIDGKEVTKENIQEFEINPEKKATNSEIRREIVEETYPEETKEELYKKSDLEKLSFKELKVIGKKFGTTDRSKANLIKEILKLQK